MTVSDLPAINASLNALSACLLVTGWRFIRAERRAAHRNCMMAALVTSTAFLCCYLYYHYSMKKLHGAAHTSFVEPAWFRPFYLVILFTHLIGAFAIVPLVLITVTRALRERFDRHKASPGGPSPSGSTSPSPASSSTCCSIRSFPSADRCVGWCLL